ncbi:hypothetical protein F4775DRAFT_98737 [Biscogniauxia sp. FL1348]|nr:hypothetical protein F4775DRAFT_98737 [Biscogniauxia sp. FL1348]
MATEIMAPSLEVPHYYPSETRQKFGRNLFPKARPAAEEVRYADIGYGFDEDKYLKRRDARVQAGGLRTDLPVGWPKALEGPLVWTKSDISDDYPIIYHLTESDKKEIVDALAYFKGLGKMGKDVDQSSFPLPSLAKTLTAIRDNIYQGRGFSTIRGLDVDEFCPDDLVTVYLGITSYIGEVRGKQNQNGVMLINVMNNSDQVEKENATVQMPFHADVVCDVVSLLTVSCGEGGGCGFVASAWTVYNELAATRPDLIHVLAEPNWPFDTHGRNPSYYERAVMFFEDGKLIVNFSKQTLVGHLPVKPRTPGIPGLSEAQAEALDALDYIGRKNAYSQPSHKGDIRLFNNLALMHRRDAFTDSEDNYRHLLRLWLHNDSQCWKLPKALEVAWDRTFRDTERPEKWHIAKNGSTRLVTPLWQENCDEIDCADYAVMCD